MKKSNKKYVVFHGHFYQPPRETPWTGKIEKEEGAEPFKNWNERITHECYIPNAEYDNYKNINFNFGPTLLDWIEKEHKKLYKKIILAGNENAIAQVYNHIIMPLADYQDKIIQIYWGVRHFQKHFKRKPYGIWLAETAVDYHTVDALVEFPFIKYIILSPFQANRIRKIGNWKWINVSGGRIDTSKVYRVYSKRYPDKYINVFFYNHKLSHSISFDKALKNPSDMIERIKEESGELVLIATDGETFGHHYKEGAEKLRDVIELIKKDNSLEITNLARFLEKREAEWEVELDLGEDGLGSAWSCSHGVGRWYRDCGCRIEKSLSQKWRKPLRDAMNYLSSVIKRVYIEETKDIYKDIWEARKEYIRVILNEIDFDKFVEKYSRDRGKQIKSKKKLKYLMELQRINQFIFTSCGWFYDDITHTSSIIILRWGIWGIKVLSKVIGKKETEEIKKEYIKILRQAKSNFKGDGGSISERLLRESDLSAQKRRQGK